MPAGSFAKKCSKSTNRTKCKILSNLTMKVEGQQNLYFRRVFTDKHNQIEHVVLMRYCWSQLSNFYASWRSAKLLLRIH